MTFTEAQAWMDAHELIECKLLKGRWTRKTCLEISKRTQKTQKNVKAKTEEVPAAKAFPCADCPVFASIKHLDVENTVSNS